MLTIKYTPEAAKDIAKIIDYTKKTWGEAQAKTYIKGMIKTIELIAAFPQIGTPSSINITLLRFNHQKHYIYYRSDDDYLYIAAIQHVERLPTIEIL